MEVVSRKVIGSGIDCLDLGSLTPIGDDGGFAISNTTFFHLPGGTIVSLSRTTIQPVETPTAGATHITGEVADSQNILASQGTGKFWNVEGSTRLSGAVNLSRLGAENIVTFDCVFLIDLD